MAFDRPAVVIDTGSETVKVGFSDEDQPRESVPNVIGRGRYSNSSEYFWGQEAMDKRGILALSWPMTGCVTKWDDMELVWGKGMSTVLSANPEDHPVLQSFSPSCHSLDKKELVQRMFEHFRVPAFYVAAAPVLALCASGRVSGTVLDVGHEKTLASSVFEGHVMEHTSKFTNIAGHFVTSEMNNWTRIDVAVQSMIKKKMGFVAMDYEKEMENYNNSDNKTQGYELPSGEVIDVDNASLFASSEVLFTPSLGKSEVPGVKDLTLQSIRDCDPNIQQTMRSNIVLAGGSTLFRGFPERLAKDLATLAGPGEDYHVTAPEDRLHSIWKGGSILAMLDSHKANWITKQEYEENGSGIVFTKSF